MKNKKIIIAGGTGFIGQALAEYFGKDNHVVILSRQAANTENNSYSKKRPGSDEEYNITYWRWDGRRVEPHWAGEIDGSDLVINLSGRSVNCRYTKKNKKEILYSRTEATEAIGQAIKAAAVPPKLWINAASATIYRHAEDHAQDEYTGEMTDHSSVARIYDTHDDFSLQVCKAWEKAFEAQRTPFTRKIALRMAVAFGDGGALVPFLRLVKLGLGGPQGSGRQMFSWLHIEDLCRSVDWFFDHPELEGVYNLAAPGPVTNREIMASLRKVTGHRIGLPAYRWMLTIGAALIGTETELILKSRWVVPAKLLATGFVFRYPDVEDALKAIVERLPRSRYHLF